MNKLQAQLLVTYPHVEVGLPALPPHGPDGGDHEPGQLHAAVSVVRAGHYQHTLSWNTGTQLIVDALMNTQCSESHNHNSMTSVLPGSPATQ